MEVIRHGNKFSRKVVCPVCQCEFIYNKDDILSKDNYDGIVAELSINFGAKFPKDTQKDDYPYYVICPECGHKIQDTITDKSGLLTPKVGTINLEGSITTTPGVVKGNHISECDHSEIEWDYSKILTSNPPKIQGVCKKCGAVVYSTPGEVLGSKKPIILASDEGGIKCR